MILYRFCAVENLNPVCPETPEKLCHFDPIAFLCSLLKSAKILYWWASPSKNSQKFT